MQKTSGYRRTEVFFDKFICAFLIHSFIQKNVAKIAIFLLNRHYFEIFALIKKSLPATIAKEILFNAIYLLFVSHE
jgi:hypothetical protein